MIRIISRICCILIYMMMLVCPEGYAVALQDSFTVTGTVISADASSPSVPSNLTATPVATTQIDLAWDASTDNVGVTGYQVFRDAIQVATTSLAMYSDIGLMPSSTYSYTVSAFDAAGNISAQSASVSATTLTPSATTSPAAEGGGAPRTRSAELISLRIVPGSTSAVIVWETRSPTRSVLRWGMGASYESGSLAEQAFSTLHSTRLTDLLPGTRYEFIIMATDQYGIEFTLARQAFTTSENPDTLAPSNPNAFRAVRDGEIATRLTWKNPPEEDFESVRIVRNNNFYPTDPYDGRLIYEGSDTEFYDPDALLVDARAYYAIFAIDRNGNLSSGAVTMVTRDGSVSDIVAASSSPLFTLADIEFIQEGKQITFVANEHGGDIPIDATKPLIIRIAYDILPEDLKTIIVTLTAPSDPSATFSFLLRIDAAKTAYTAQVAPLEMSGRYPLEISVVNYALKTTHTAYGTLVAMASFQSSEDIEGDGIFARISSRNRAAGMTALMLFFLLLILFARSRRSLL